MFYIFKSIFQNNKSVIVMKPPSGFYKLQYKYNLKTYFNIVWFSYNVEYDCISLLTGQKWSCQYPVGNYK